MNSTKRGRGRPPGSPNGRTVEHLEYLTKLRRDIMARYGTLSDGLLSAAEGQYHLMAKDTSGQWVQVTDPVIATKVLNGPQEYLKLVALKPDMQAQKIIWERMWGQPVLPVAETDREGNDLTSESDEDLLAKAAEISAKYSTKHRKHGPK